MYIFFGTNKLFIISILTIAAMDYALITKLVYILCILIRIYIYLFTAYIHIFKSNVAILNNNNLMFIPIKYNFATFVCVLNII